MLPVAILAGGYGTRLGAPVPKALASVAGEPFIFYQLRLLANAGVTNVVICVGYGGVLIRQAVGYDRYGVRVRYSDEGERPVGTLWALRKAAPLLGDRFLCLYGDAYLRVNYEAAVLAWELSGTPAMMTVCLAKGLCDPNARVRGYLVIDYLKRWGFLSPDFHWVDYGLGGLTVESLLAAKEDDDLSQLHSRLARTRQLCAFRVRDRFYEIGTPGALAETDRFLRLDSSSGSGSPL